MQMNEYASKTSKNIRSNEFLTESVTKKYQKKETQKKREWGRKIDSS